jgi:hypothetical protein
MWRASRNLKNLNAAIDRMLGWVDSSFIEY